MKYQQDLEVEIDELFRESLHWSRCAERLDLRFILENYKKHNDSKNVFAFSRTPTTFISMMVICYLIAGILETIWLGGLNFIFMFAFWACFILLFIWLYTKYSGDRPEVGEYIDHFADVIWTKVWAAKEFRDRSKSLSIFLRAFNRSTLNVCNRRCDLSSDMRNPNEHMSFCSVCLFFFTLLVSSLFILARPLFVRLSEHVSMVRGCQCAQRGRNERLPFLSFFSRSKLQRRFRFLLFALLQHLSD